MNEIVFEKVRLVDLRQMIPKANLNKTLSFGPSALVRLQNLEKSPASRTSPRLSTFKAEKMQSYVEMIDRIKSHAQQPVVIRYDPLHDDTDIDNDHDDDLSVQDEEQTSGGRINRRKISETQRISSDNKSSKRIRLG